MGDVACAKVAVEAGVGEVNGDSGARNKPTRIPQIFASDAANPPSTQQNPSSNKPGPRSP